MVKPAAFISLFALASLLSCTDSDCGNPCGSPKPIDPRLTEGARTQLDTLVAQASIQFGAQLLGQFVEWEIEKGDDRVANLALSPVSAAFALGMAALGAEGETRDEMLRALNWPGLQDTELVATLNRLKNSIELADSRLQATTANSAWIKQGFSILDTYRHHLSGMRAEAAEVDFALPATTARINDWVKAKTQGIIESIIDPGETLSPDLAIMLVNATYFKGAWAQAFDPKSTYRGEFRLQKSRRANEQTTGQAESLVTVHFMRRSGAKLPYLDNHAMFTAVALPFGAGGMEMVFILPTASYSIWDVARNLAVAPHSLDARYFDSTQIDIALPKFHLKSDLDLIPTLQLLGMSQAFSNDADFSGMAEARLKIGKVKQTADVRIDESGAEAAAVTRIDMVLTSVPIVPQFIADRPFLFVIRESRGLGYWLFAGVVANPGEQP